MKGYWTLLHRRTLLVELVFTLRHGDIARFCRQWFRSLFSYWVNITIDIGWGSFSMSINEVSSSVVALINFIDPMRQSLASPTFTVDKPSNCKKKSTRANWDKDFFHWLILTAWTCSQKMISFEKFQELCVPTQEILSWFMNRQQKKLRVYSACIQARIIILNGSNISR